MAFGAHEPPPRLRGASESPLTGRTDECRVKGGFPKTGHTVAANPGKMPNTPKNAVQ